MIIRPRRLRTTRAMRSLVAETRVHPAQLVLPVFVADGLTEPAPITSLPGVVQHTLRSVADEARLAVDAGLKGIMLFGVPKPEDKDAYGSIGWAPDGILNRGLSAVRDAVGDDGGLVREVDRRRRLREARPHRRRGAGQRARLAARRTRLDHRQRQHATGRADRHRLRDPAAHRHAAHRHAAGVAVWLHRPGVGRDMLAAHAEQRAPLRGPRGFEFGVAGLARLDQQRHLVGRLNAPLPAVDRAARRRQDVDAGR